LLERHEETASASVRIVSALAKPSSWIYLNHKDSMNDGMAKKIDQ
jgi:hypothetical protein